MTGIREQLRTATAAAHERLEVVMALDDPALDTPRYGAALQLLHSVRAGWEPGLEALVPGSRGPHLTWLQADLNQLGLDPAEPAPPLPFHDAAPAWGALYVLGGSALGGRMLLRRVAPLGFTEEHGARYFAGDGEATGVQWRAFLARLDSAATPAAIPGILHGAQAAFAALLAQAARQAAHQGATTPR